jgi:hemolysin III
VEKPKETQVQLAHVAVGQGDANYLSAHWHPLHIEFFEQAGGEGTVVVYGAGLLAMLGCSALSNTTAPGPFKALWRRLDHAAIFVMIAGTYTPFAAVAIGGSWGTGLLVFVWSVAVAGVALKLFHPERIEALSTAAYLLLGWTILVAIDRLIAAVSLPALVLLASGGILYSVGVLFYRWRRLPYRRAIWHSFVLTGAACHYFAILDVVVT